MVWMFTKFAYICRRYITPNYIIKLITDDEMKKLTGFLLLIMMLVLPSCNEDIENYDELITQAVHGSWTSVNDTDSQKLVYKFVFRQDGTFMYEYSYTNVEGTKVWSVNGTWNVYHSLLQLKYSVDSMMYDGMTAEEVAAAKKNMTDNNLQVEEQNKKDRAHGMNVEITSYGGQRYLKLSGISGTFTYQGIY